MVVQSNRMGNLLEVLLQDSIDLPLFLRHKDGAVTRIYPGKTLRFHGEVEKDRFASVESLLRKFQGVGTAGKERERDGQVVIEEMCCCGPAVAYIVDNHRNDTWRGSRKKYRRVLGRRCRHR